MEKPTKKIPALKNKRKRKIQTSVSEPKNFKTVTMETQEPVLVPSPPVKTKRDSAVQKTELPQVMYKGLTMEEIGERYPIFKNEELVKRFLNVSMTNNQKGRLRQVLRDHFRGTSEILLPDVIHNKIQTILKSSENLNDTDLRKLRILYNMLKTAALSEKVAVNKQKRLTEKKLSLEKEGAEKTSEDTKKKEDTKMKDLNKEALVKKVKGPKRYVVFVGNLPLDIDKEKLLKHFSALSVYIRDVRIPPPGDSKRSAIAYLELANEPSYELALSKHHSMLDNRRINVMYTTQKKTKISKTEAKGKAAKLLALQKSGKLLGSVPLNRKRSHRRRKMKEALAKQSATA